MAWVQAAAVAPLLPRPRPGGMFFSTVISTPIFSPLMSSSALAGGPAEFFFGSLGSSRPNGPRALILMVLVLAVLTCTLSAYLLSASANTSKPAPRLAVEQYASTLTALAGTIEAISRPRLVSPLIITGLVPTFAFRTTGKPDRIAQNQP